MNAHAFPSPAASWVGSTVHLLGTLVTLRAGAADTGGAFSLAEIVVAPGQGTPPHRHEDAESFLVLDGAVTFAMGDEPPADGPLVARAGDFVHLPAGTPHAFRNAGDGPARMLGLNMPGGPHERFFREVGEPVADATRFPPLSPPDVPRLIEAGLRHGITILPPA